MILHGDGSTNIFVKDGLLPFNYYTKEKAPNVLISSLDDSNYPEKKINGQFDVVVSNPPFSVDLDNDTKSTLSTSFIIADKKNSENLFIERYYHLLREGGRMGIVLPESVFDTTENKYIRLFIYKYFKIKAVVSLPQITFAPYTPTKTSILFAQKKTHTEIEQWNAIWNEKAKEYSQLRTRCENICAVADGKKRKEKLPSIKDMSETEEKQCILSLLRNLIPIKDRSLPVKEMVFKYREEIDMVCTWDKETKDAFGVVNTWWVFGEVAKELSYSIFMAEAENVGYKRTHRSEQVRPNDLYRTGQNNEVIIDDGKKETILDFIREIKW
jgi:type I restriction enzyme M protein